MVRETGWEDAAKFAAFGVRATGFQEMLMEVVNVDTVQVTSAVAAVARYRLAVCRKYYDTEVDAEAVRLAP